MKKVLIIAVLLAVVSSAVSFKLISPFGLYQLSFLYTNLSPLPDTFEDCGSLTFENYGLKQLDPKKFVKLRRLVELHTTGNQLNVLGGNEFENLPELQVLYLKFNAISEIPKNEFTNLQKLRQLYLDENSICVIDKDLFPASLEVISLSANDIAKLHYKTFSRLTNLRKLDVSFNSLTALHGEILSGNMKLEELNMHGNRLMYIGPQIFDQLANLVVADFEKNPCINSWIKSNNIARLNQTIHNACTVTVEMQMEWLQEKVQHLKEENAILKTQGDGQCSSTAVAPIMSLIDDSTIILALSDYRKMQQESTAMKDELQKLKTLINSKALAETKDKASDNSSCEAELEKLQLEMNDMEGKNLQLDTDSKLNEDYKNVEV